MIRAEGLTKVFGAHPERALALRAEGVSKEDILARTGCTVGVDDVSFSIARGELFVIMGLSGSGKSTVIRLVNRLIEPTAGTVQLDGRDLSGLDDAELREARNRRLSMVFQQFAIFPHRTVRENAAYGLHVRRVTERERREQTAWALNTVGLSAWSDAYPAALSGGMKQRVGLARALATGADVMLMDEPFSALDPLIRREMQELILRLHRELQRTIIFVTHDLNEAMRLGERIMLMRDGRIVQLGTGREILERPADLYVSDFVADVDRSRVLTAGDVMRQPLGVALPGEHPSDVQARLERIGARGIYVVADGRIVGAATSDTVGRALAGGATEIGAAGLDVSFDTVPLDTPLLEVCGRVGGHAVPLAVLDDSGQLAGVVPRSAALAGVAAGG